MVPFHRSPAQPIDGTIPSQEHGAGLQANVLHYFEHDALLSAEEKSWLNADITSTASRVPNAG